MGGGGVLPSSACARGMSWEPPLIAAGVCQPSCCSAKGWFPPARAVAMLGADPIPALHARVDNLSDPREGAEPGEVGPVLLGNCVSGRVVFVGGVESPGSGMWLSLCHSMFALELLGVES